MVTYRTSTFGLCRQVAALCLYRLSVAGTSCSDHDREMAALSRQVPPYKEVRPVGCCVSGSLSTSLTECEHLMARTMWYQSTIGSSSTPLLLVWGLRMFRHWYPTNVAQSDITQLHQLVRWSYTFLSGNSAKVIMACKSKQVLTCWQVAPSCWYWARVDR